MAALSPTPYPVVETPGCHQWRIPLPSLTLLTRSHSGLRLGPYLTATNRGIQITSKPALVDPFPLQALGAIVQTTTTALARHFVTHGVADRGESA